MGPLQLCWGAQLADQETDLALPRGMMLQRPHLLEEDMQTPISSTSILLLIAQAESQVQGIAPAS